MLKLRIDEKSEIAWVNERYDEVEFVHSNFDREIIAIAEFEEQKAGVGRLVSVDEAHLELGGMYVFEPFRGKGIAKKLVLFLLQHVRPSQTVYCIPFEHLVDFYKQCGFVLCSQHEQVPKELLEKYRWCKEKYSHPTSLLVMTGVDAVKASVQECSESGQPNELAPFERK
jgi:GNAT superfamily N-acetyltransferase